MKKSQLFGALVAALSLSSAVSAQSTAPVAGASLLGTRSAELGFSYVNLNHISNNGYAGNLSVNLPIATGFDLAAGYNYSWIENYSDIDAQSLNLSAIGYRTIQDVTVFGVASLGYTWIDSVNDDDFDWAVRAGAEYNVNPNLTLIGSIGYDDDFGSGSEGSYDGTVRVNYRASDKFVPYVAASWLEGGSVGASVGVAYKF